MNDIPYLLRGVMPPIATESSVLVSSSKYLNDPRLRDWIARICLRKNGPDYPPSAEMHELIGLLRELRDEPRIEELFTEERRMNPTLDRWFREGFVSTFTLEDLARYPEGTVARIFYDRMAAGGFELEIYPFDAPRSQLDYFLLRAGQCHDFEHIITGGGFDFMGELVPFWFRLTNVFKHLKNQELAGELSVMSIFGSLRYTVRTLLFYPEIWLTCVDAIRRGQRVGLESDAIFLAKYEDVFALPLKEARAALGVRGVVDADTSREGAIFADCGPVAADA